MSFYNGINTLTGDCSNTGSGGFTVYLTNENFFSPPFTVQWIFPESGTTFSSTTILNSTYSVTGLTAGTYSFNVLGQSGAIVGPINYTIFINSANTISLQSFQSTTCGSSNGTITLNAPNTIFVNNYYLYNQNGLVNSATTSNSIYTFTDLSSGLYYAEAVDYGNCQGISNSIFVGESTQLDFGLYTINSPACLVDNGQIYVTGVTGTPPYTYYWGEGVYENSSESFKTGLTSGAYSVDVTDVFGCTTSKNTVVGNASALGIQTYSVISPNCMINNGSITLIISGGSAPYYYLLSNGDSQILLSNEVTFTGLSSGNYVLNVTDVGLCTTSLNFSLLTPQTFSVISTSSVEQSCNTLGSINVNLQGGTPPYHLNLSGNSTSLSQTIFVNSTTFNGLIGGTYNLTINDTASACTYTETLIVGNNSHFDIGLSSTGSTCANNNGVVRVDIINQYLTGLTWVYSLSNGLTSVPTEQNFYQFTGLTTGFHTVTVTDTTGCSKQLTQFVTGTSPYSIFLYTTECLQGDAGTITALIQESDGPFILTWSDNVNGQTGYYVTGLTAGTYTLTVSGETDCITSVSTTISCTPLSGTNHSFKYTSGNKTSSSTSKLSLKNMMYQGYSQIATSGDSCSLSSCTFYLKVNIAGTDYQFPFYNTSTFNNIPEFSEFTTVLQNAILTIPHITTCIIDPIKNTINIVSESDGNTEYYKGETVLFTVILDFTIKCRSVNSVPC
jgi:hypothetical protein